MPFTLTMPKLSPTMEEGTIVKWHKKVGEAVAAGDVLLEIATDKATVEYNSLEDGWLRQILANEGQEVIVNQPIAILSADQNENLENYLPPQTTPTPPPAAPIVPKEKEKEEPTTPPKPTLAQPKFTPEPPLVSTRSEVSKENSEKRVLASPLAKKLAKEKGLDLSTLKGTGPNQRIMSRDLAQAQPISASGFSPRALPQIPAGSFDEQPLSPIRKIIGQRLQESKSFIPHFYVTLEINAEPLTGMREQLKTAEIKLSINDFIIKACALALREHPEINTGFHAANQTIIQFKTVDIAIAVSIESGLITPIIRYADYKNLPELAAEIRQLAQRAREGKLDPQEYKGGSFTVSNLGMHGVTNFQAILNPPQAAILAVSAIRETPVIHQGKVVPGKTLNLTLSVDHRVIDGVAAAIFLQTLKRILENPAIMLIN